MLKLVLHATSYAWSFLPAGSGTFTDSGTTSCRFSGAAIDTSPPTTPTGLQVVATPTEADLSWAAASDNVGVAAYRILRDGALVATIPAADLHYRDTASLVAGRTYGYAVAAADAAGNVSATSPAVQVMIPSSSGNIFSDGFESGSFSAWNGGSAVNMTVQAVTAHTGRAAEAIVGSLAYSATRTLASSYSTVYVRTYFRLHSKSTNVGIARIRTASGIDIVHLYVDNATGQLGLRNDVSGVSLLSGHLVTVDAWHWIETKVVINGTSSTIQVLMDGADQTGLEFDDDEPRHLECRAGHDR